MFGITSQNVRLNQIMFFIEIGSAIVLLAVSFALYFYSRKKKKVDKYLIGLLLDIAVNMLSDCFANIYGGALGLVGWFVVRVGNCIYYVTNVLAAWFVVNYTIGLIEDKHCVVSSFWKKMSNWIMAIANVFIFLNIFFRFYYTIDGNNEYARGPFFIFSHIPAALLIILLVALLIFYHNTIKKTESLTVLSFVVLPVLATVVQIFDYGFSWLQLAMAFSAFLIVIEYVLIGNKTTNFVWGQTFLQESRLLQKRIIMVVCVVVVVFFGVIAKIAIAFASTQMRHEVKAHYQMLANKTNEEASTWIERETQIVLNQKASLEIVNNFDLHYLEEYLSYVVKDYNYDGYIYDLYFVNTDNEMASGVGYEADPAIDFRQRDWYQRALSADNACYTVPYVDADTGRYVVTVSIKVFDRSRRFVGVLALDIFVDNLLSVTQQTDVPDDSYLFIVDDQMGMVTHPFEQYGYVNGKSQKLSDISGKEYKRLEQFIKEEPEKEAFIKLKDYDGMKRCFFVSKVEECGWYIVAAISQNVIDDAQRTLGESIFVALIICLALGVVLALWTTNNVVKQLTEAREEAYAANEAKSRFLANMSHEIRTPINAVLGMDEILLRECKDDNLRPYALNIQSAGQALLGLVNDILDFSKIESDKLDLVMGKYELAELMGSCINLIQFRAQEKGLTFTVKRDDYLPKTLYGDEVRVRQIISNLLTNAVKYTKQGSVTLSVSWNMEQDCLVVKVSDTGIGMKKEGLEEIFTSFQRLDEKKNRNIEGSGLGLSITKQLVELMKGEINVQSEYGKGSEFVVRIPQIVMDETAAGDFVQETDLDRKNETVQYTTRDTRILVVDDVKMNLEVVKGLLKHSGIEIDVAQRGMEAIEKIQHQRYDIIFLDHMMPELDGMETLNLMRNRYGDCVRETPIIMLTANAIMGAEEEYKKAGFTGYLSKPVDRKSLNDCILQNLPKEKIIMSNGEESENMAEEEQKIEKPLQYLQNHIDGFEAEVGLSYCGDMEDILLMMLNEYVESEAMQRMVDAYDKQDYQAYRISVHSLKSTSMMVGFTKLSEEARLMELAAKEERIDYINEHHEQICIKHREICNSIRMVLGLTNEESI